MVCECGRQTGVEKIKSKWEKREREEKNDELKIKSIVFYFCLFYQLIEDKERDTKFRLPTIRPNEQQDVIALDLIEGILTDVFS